CGISDVGRRRRTNEDRFFISPAQSFWIVADGMGGEASGELACELTINAISESLLQSSVDDQHQNSIETNLQRAFASAQERVLAHTVDNPECTGMGSAALAALIAGNSLHLCHVGDVRCYLRTRRTLNLITEDHSPVAKLVKLGLLTREQARLSPQKGRL